MLPRWIPMWSSPWLVKYSFLHSFSTFISCQASLCILNHYNLYYRVYISFYNSQSLFTLINTGLFAVDTEISGLRYFCRCGFDPWPCGFLLVGPAQQHKRCGGRSDPQLTRWREGPTKEGHNNNQNPITTQSKPIINGIPRASISKDQGDYTTEPHWSPTIEVHMTNSGSQNRKILEAEANKKSLINNGKKKK